MHHHVNQDEFLTSMISIISKIVVQIKKNKINVDWWNEINYHHQPQQMILKVLCWSKINYHHQPQQMILKVLVWSKIDSKNLTLVNRLYQYCPVYYDEKVYYSKILEA